MLSNLRSYQTLLLYSVLLGALACGNQAGGPDAQASDASPRDANPSERDSSMMGRVCPPAGSPPLGELSAGPGGQFETYIESTQGNVAVRVKVPARPRYREHTQVVVNVATFFTTTAPFYSDV